MMRPLLPAVLLTGLGLIDAAAGAFAPVSPHPALAALGLVPLLGALWLLTKGARWVRFGAALLLGMGLASLLGAAAGWPLSLTWTAARLFPAIAGWSGGLGLLNLAALAAVLRTSRPHANGQGLETPARMGVGVAFLGAFLLWMTLHGQSAALATSLALQQLGPTYRYQLVWVSRESDGPLKLITGTVAAWNDQEIRPVIIRWRDK
jgi:hypothetical protein